MERDKRVGGRRKGWGRFLIYLLCQRSWRPWIWPKLNHLHLTGDDLKRDTADCLCCVGGGGGGGMVDIKPSPSRKTWECVSWVNYPYWVRNDLDSYDLYHNLLYYVKWIKTNQSTDSFPQFKIFSSSYLFQCQLKCIYAVYLKTQSCAGFDYLSRITAKWVSKVIIFILRSMTFD